MDALLKRETSNILRLGEEVEVKKGAVHVQVSPAKPSSDNDKPQQPAGNFSIEEVVNNTSQPSGNFDRDEGNDLPQQAAVNSEKNEGEDKPKHMGGHCDRDEESDKVEDKAGECDSNVETSQHQSDYYERNEDNDERQHQTGRLCKDKDRYQNHCKSYKSTNNKQKIEKFRQLEHNTYTNSKFYENIILKNRFMFFQNNSEATVNAILFGEHPKEDLSIIKPVLASSVSNKTPKNAISNRKIIKKDMEGFKKAIIKNVENNNLLIQNRFSSLQNKSEEPINAILLVEDLKETESTKMKCRLCGQKKLIAESKPAAKV